MLADPVKMGAYRSQFGFHYLSKVFIIISD